MIKSIFLTLFALVLSLASHAEEAAGPSWLTALQVQVKPGMSGEYERLIKRFVEANNEAKSDFYWGANKIRYGEQGVYNFVRIHNSIAGLQSQPSNVIGQVFGDETAQAQTAGLARTVARSSQTAYIALPHATIAAPQDYATKHWSILRVTVKPMANDAYEDYITKVREATEALTPNAYYFGYGPQWGSSNTYLFAIPLPDLADLGPPPISIPERLRKHFGTRAADKLLSQRADLVESQEILLSTARPDLSRLP